MEKGYVTVTLSPCVQWHLFYPNTVSEPLLLRDAAESERPRRGTLPRSNRFTSVMSPLQRLPRLLCVSLFALRNSHTDRIAIIVNHC